MKSKIFLTLLIIVVSVSMVVGGTMAYFSDFEGLTGNTFAAGGLDLQLGTAGSLPFTVGNTKPGDSGKENVTLTNAGTLDGNLDISLTNYFNLENALTEPELNPGYGTHDYEAGPSAGELKFFLLIAVFVDVNKDGIFNSGDYQLAYNGQKSAYPGFWPGDFHYSGVESMLPAWSNVMTMAAGQSVDLVIMWQFPTESGDSNYSQNIAMTDSLGFDIQMTLNQPH